MSEPRSGCPINLTLEVLGDRWSLVVIRDMMFGNRHYFRELMRGSMEGIASNILADRLKRLEARGLVTKGDDPSHKQKARYNLTEAAIELLPLLVAMGAWGRRHLPVTPELAIRNQLLEEGGPELIAAFMDELRVEHLGAAPDPAATPVRERLDAARAALAACGGEA
ncbi:helix-turn-helix transcriptional regulator [Sphingomonas sp. BT-65]|uniref:winged helix-turn-helix transcriptional regulator n=1 Tax=Sphingomonas sp. BT-65 TaxID=2989821 RepID=UPI002235D861|nr:helix-turn-helix domain-containing protein [Sphingomonas sp. BT-65]MCW4461969.1 helix-turn-helix transcriptional regulator [Sphingomonas sp. BT-65]